MFPKTPKTPIKNDKVIIDTRTVGPFAANSYLIACADTKEGALIDACDNFPALKEMIEAHGITLKYLLQTHAHLDHVAALKEMKEWSDAPILLHPAEKELYDNIPMQCRLFGLPPFPSPPAPDQWIQGGEELKLGNLTIHYIDTPGHSPGSITFQVKADKEYLFAGDTLFEGSIGRTDLPGGSYGVLMNSLQILLQSPDDTVVLSGHGGLTTIGKERKTNPFLS
mgnify:CR=1 FL=1